MELFQLFLCKYLFGYILQDIIVILGVYTFSKQKVHMKTFLTLNAILIPTSILVRLLPISLGIHTLINMAVILAVMYRLCQFELYTIIRSTLITSIILLLNEMVCIFTLVQLMGYEKVDSIMSDSLMKSLVYVPFNILYGIIIVCCYKRMLKKQH